ncbi:MAG: sulfite exporter TauE/SafE family protein [Alphaproteobacteria bacterium]|nr:sulfite exporter TauE/SafE family protein [Alphaproteobacteria bacterium]MBM3647626.1 sulfite exporter TauE/SafE family protein [Alphaproteobacteria bacterium]
MHDHSAALLSTSAGFSEAWLLASLLLLAGLWGGVTHCAGMCGPFVLTQIDQRLDTSPGDFGRWQRLKGAALLPYHFGRATTYALLGAASGGFGGLIAEWSGLRWVAAAFLIAGGLLFGAQAIGLPALRALRAPVLLGRLAAWLAAKPSTVRHYALGITLGFLPCGLLYGALTAAAAAGSAMAGALAMVAFTAGTVPALMAVGWGGVLLGARRRQLLQRLTRPMLAANALALILLAMNLTR